MARELFREQAGEEWVSLQQQDPRTGQRIVHHRSHVLLGCGELERDDDSELGAASHFAVDFDAAAHQSNELLADGETKSGSAVFPRRRSVLLSERLEDPRERFLLDTHAGVRDAQLKLDAVLLEHRA